MQPRDVRLGVASHHAEAPAAARPPGALGAHDPTGLGPPEPLAIPETVL
jgi:hypothetical protein